MAKRGWYDAGLECDFFVPVRGAYATAHFDDDEFQPAPRGRRSRRFPFPRDEHVWPATVTNFRFIFGDDLEIPIFRKRSKFLFGIDVDGETGIYRNLGADTLRFWFSGAASDGGTQASVAGCLGNYRSSTEATRVGLLFPNAMRGLRVELASRAVADAGFGIVGNMVALDADTVAFTATDGSRGPEVAIANGETKRVEDGLEPSKFLRITRISSSGLSGQTAVEADDQFGNVFAGADASDGNTTAGRVSYAECRLRGELLAAPVRSIYAWLKVLGSSAVSTLGQLGSSGGGTIQGASYCFADWPLVGWCHIYTAGGTLREIVYYRARTDQTLTVLAGGRHRCGSSAAAGAADDVCWPAGGLRIGFETPSPAIGGAVQTIPNDTTAPTGITWNKGLDLAHGLGPVSLATGGSVGLWIERDLPAGAEAYSKHANQIRVQFTVGDTTYVETLGGLWRAAVTAADRYEFYYGVDAEPDLTAGPQAVSATLPWTPTDVFATGHTYWLVTQKRNQYGLVTGSIDTTALVVAGGVQVNEPPSDPELQVFEAAASGGVHVVAFYAAAADGALKANQWLVYLKTGGGDPNPALDTPTVVTLSQVFGGATLDAVYGAYSEGTVVKCLVRVRRTSDSIDSTNTDVSDAVTATAVEPSAPGGTVHYRGIAEQK